MAGVDAIAGAVKEGLSLWKTFIATRQEAYNRRQDKAKDKAISIAEVSFEQVGKLFDFLLTVEMDEEQKKDLEKHKRVIYRMKAKFNRYD